MERSAIRGLFPQWSRVSLRSTQATSYHYLVRISASQMPPPIMKPPETRETSRVRRAEKNRRARPAASA
jgi:hypothetical protein